MISKAQVQDLEKKDQYTLQLEASEQSKKINLLVRTSRNKIDVYSSQIHSLEDIKNLQDHFDDMETFTEYVKDPTHWQLNLEQRSLMIIERSPTKKNKVTEIAAIPLKFMETVEKEQSQGLINSIVERCNSKEQFKQADIKDMFETIAVCLSELVSEKKQHKQTRKEVEGLNERILTLENQARVIKQQKQKSQQQFLQFKNESEIKMVQLQSRLQKLQKQQYPKIMGQIQRQETKIDLISGNLIKLGEVIDRQVKQNSLNESTIQKTSKELDTISGRLQIIQSSLKRNQVQKIMEKIQTPTNQQKQEIGPIIVAKDWIDPESYFYQNNSLQFDKNTIKNKRIIYSYVIGRNILNNNQSFTVEFTNIARCVIVGIVQTRQKKNNNINMGNIVFHASHVKPGFKVGQKITVLVNFDRAQVEFTTQGKLLSKVIDQKLKDTDIKWAPFIQFNNPNDSAIIHK